jgi:hypothetical protein
VPTDAGIEPRTVATGAFNSDLSKFYKIFICLANENLRPISSAWKRGAYELYINRERERGEHYV